MVEEPLCTQKFVVVSSVLHRVIQIFSVISFNTRAQLFEGRLELNPGLNLTRVSLSCVQKHCLG